MLTGSSAVEHAAAASTADAYSSLVKDEIDFKFVSIFRFFHPREVSSQVFMDVSHDPCISGQVQEAILGDKSAPSVCETASEACILDPTSL
ncbi:Protein of unknown function, partial [Gryllus bimaculatus]